MNILRQALIFLFLLANPVAVLAQAPPAPLSQQQFDDLVNALAKAVGERLKEQGAGGAASPRADAPAADLKAPAAGPAEGKSPVPGHGMMAMNNEEPISMMFLDLLDKGEDTLLASPRFLTHLGRIPGLLQADMNGGRSAGMFLLLLVIASTVALGAEAAVRFVLMPLRRRLAASVVGAPGLWALAALLGLDLLGLLVLWLVTHSFVVTWFHGATPQARLGFLLLTSLFYWRLYIAAFRVALRPALPQARLADIGDADAAKIYRWSGGAFLLAIVLADLRRVLEGVHAPQEVLAFTLLLNTTIMSTVFISVAIVLREPVERWLRGLSQDGKSSPIAATIAHYWLAVAIPVLLVFGLTRAYGALTTHTGAVEALVMTANVLIGLLLLESLMDKTCRLLEGELQQIGSKARQRAIEAVMRCVRVALFIGAGALLARIWAVNGVGMMEQSRYNEIAGAALPAGGILFAAYCAWQAIEYFTGLYRPTVSSGVPGLQDPDDAAATTVSRIATLMPLLRVALIIAVIVMAGLTVLSQLGVNITPLIAGASIIGLAISFGSQTLVKDIVSGVFYLVDDAFRVGEYIDCGKAKGTVEGFTLRSLKLRHQNGMIHTIPFGQLGQITNFSRDWTTMKFNLRFTRDTDLEKLRKAVKKIGQEMLEDPEMKDEFLMPLKMQGVADIADSALIVRFKFTVKPSKPTFVQREAVKRMIRILPQQGIEFANATVAVQSLGGAADHAAAAASARAKTISDQTLAAQAAEQAASA